MQENILVIEDDISFQKTLVNLLKKKGYEVSGAQDGNEAIRMAGEIHFDLIITDIRLPGMDGIETVSQIKEKHDSNMKTMVITGYADRDAPIRAIRLGVDDYIYKPFKLEEFIHSVERNIKALRLEKEKEKYIKTIETSNKELVLLYDIAQEISSHLGLAEVLGAIVDKVAVVLDAEVCSILLYDNQEDQLVIKASCGIDDKDIKSTGIKKGEDISGWVFKKKEAVFSEQIENDTRFAGSSKEKYYKGSFISVPLVAGSDVVGIMNINGTRSGKELKEDSFRFIKNLALEAAIAIKNAGLYTSLEGIYLHIVMALTSVLEDKESYPEGYSEKISKYAEVLAEQMNVPKERLDEINKAIQLHGLGKLGVHDNILTKPGRLTKEEWKEVRAHFLKGVMLLKPLRSLNEVIKIVEQHHEKYDGTGYPYGIKGEDILPEARIMAIAESFGAMMTDRPYRKALSKEEAIEELRKNKGTQFDPEMVDKFIKVVEERSDLF